MSSLRSVFQLNGTVDRGTYFAVGFFLSVLKYAVEATVIQSFTGRIYSPLDFLSPLASNRTLYFNGAPTWLPMGLILWTLPFLWVGVAMSIRRCREIGCSLWYAMLMLLPFVNYLAILWLCIIPAREKPTDGGATEQRELREIGNAPSVNATLAIDSAKASSGVIPELIGAACGVAYAIASTLLSVYVLANYGAVLFFITPLVAGAVSAFLFNRPIKRTIAATLMQVTLMIGCACCALLLFALEGVICIVMALPILLPLAVMGAFLGRAIAIETHRPQREAQGMLWCLAAVPLLAGIEGLIATNPTFAVSTTVEIQAPADAVWSEVIAFPEITERPEWFFRTGIAAPLRAHIEGSGVGAIRHCEFTTGTFVEPITVWEPNHRLGFNVSEQPDPMFELTPFKHVHPPHLKSGFRSTRGEFLLEPTSNGGTRLTGTTWYKLNMHPQIYWTLWSDELVHRIHLRVLNHIQRIAEAE